MGCSSRAPKEVRVLWKKPPGYSFSNGVVHMLTPSISTVAPAGLLAIRSLSAKACAGHASRKKTAQTCSFEWEAMSKPPRRMNPRYYYHIATTRWKHWLGTRKERLQSSRSKSLSFEQGSQNIAKRAQGKRQQDHRSQNAPWQYQVRTP